MEQLYPAPMAPVEFFNLALTVAFLPLFMSLIRHSFHLRNIIQIILFMQ